MVVSRGRCRVRPVIKNNRAFFYLKGELAMQDDVEIILITLNRLFNKTNALYSKIASELNLSVSSFNILYALGDLPGGCSQRDLCEALCLTKSTINSSVKVLLRKGFVSLQRAPDSKLIKTGCLTKTGTDFVNRNITASDS